MDSIVWIATLWRLSCTLLVEVEYWIMSLHTLFCRVWGMCMEVSVNLSQTLPLCSFASRFFFFFLFGLVVSLQSSKLHLRVWYGSPMGSPIMSGGTSPDGGWRKVHVGTCWGLRGSIKGTVSTYLPRKAGMWSTFLSHPDTGIITFRSCRHWPLAPCYSAIEIHTNFLLAATTEMAWVQHHKTCWKFCLQAYLCHPSAGKVCRTCNSGQGEQYMTPNSLPFLATDADPSGISTTFMFSLSQEVFVGSCSPLGTAHTKG